MTVCGLVGNPAGDLREEADGHVKPVEGEVDLDEFLYFKSRGPAVLVSHVQQSDDDDDTLWHWRSLVH